MWNCVLISLIIIIVIWLFVRSGNEPFAEVSGQLCNSCEGKGFNQCTNCFNCLYVVDKWNNRKCIGGDQLNGPYNKEEYSLIYSADPYTRMKYNDNHYEQVYGMSPKQANRPIGLVPCKYTFV